VIAIRSQDLVNSCHDDLAPMDIDKVNKYIDGVLSVILLSASEINFKLNASNVNDLMSVQDDEFVQIVCITHFNYFTQYKQKCQFSVKN